MQSHEAATRQRYTPRCDHPAPPQSCVQAVVPPTVCTVKDYSCPRPLPLAVSFSSLCLSSHPPLIAPLPLHHTHTLGSETHSTGKGALKTILLSWQLFYIHYSCSWEREQDMYATHTHTHTDTHTHTHTHTYTHTHIHTRAHVLIYAQHMTSTSQLMQDCTHYMCWTGMMVVWVSEKSTTLIPSRPTHREANRRLLIQQLSTVENSLASQTAFSPPVWHTGWHEGYAMVPVRVP